MSNREVASLACKILGIYIIMQGLNVFSSVVISNSIAIQNNMPHESFINIIFSLVYILFGVILWFFSDKLSSIMVKGENHSKEGSDIGAGDIQRVAFSVLGLYFMGSSLPELVSTLMSVSSMSELPDLIKMRLLVSGGSITEFIIGLGIFIGSHGLVNLLNNLRTVGLKRKDISEENDS